MSERRLKFWGWGYEEEGPDPGLLRFVADALRQRFGLGELRTEQPPRIEELDLRPPRAMPPDSLRAFLVDDPYERARHTYGQSYRDVVRALRREFPNPPDWVAFLEGEQDVVRVLDWCTSAGVAAIIQAASPRSAARSTYGERQAIC